MSKFSFTNVFRLTGFTLRVNRKQIIGWSIAVFAIAFMYMMLFPSVKDMAQIKMDAMPKEILQFVKMANFSDMGNFTTYFGTIFNMLMVAISVFAVTFAGGIIQKEEKSFAIEYVYSLETSRTEIYVSKCLTGLLAVIIVLGCTVLAAAIAGYTNGGETFVAADFFKIALMSSAIGIVFTSAALMIAGTTAKIGAGTFGSIIVMASYIAGYLATMLKSNYQWLTWFSPFDKLSSANILSVSGDAFRFLWIYLGLSLVFLIIGGLVYRKRDL